MTMNHSPIIRRHVIMVLGTAASIVLAVVSAQASDISDSARLLFDRGRNGSCSCIPS